MLGSNDPAEGVDVDNDSPSDTLPPRRMTAGRLPARRTARGGRERGRGRGHTGSGSG